MASKSENDANDGEKGSTVIRARTRTRNGVYLCCVICVIRRGRASFMSAQAFASRFTSRLFPLVPAFKQEAHFSPELSSISRFLPAFPSRFSRFPQSRVSQAFPASFPLVLAPPHTPHRALHAPFGKGAHAFRCFTGLSQAIQSRGQNSMTDYLARRAGLIADHVGEPNINMFRDMS
jgi:hypothetical protein